MPKIINIHNWLLPFKIGFGALVIFFFYKSLRAEEFCLSKYNLRHASYIDWFAFFTDYLFLQAWIDLLKLSKFPNFRELVWSILIYLIILKGKNPITHTNALWLYTCKIPQFNFKKYLIYFHKYYDLLHFSSQEYI